MPTDSPARPLLRMGETCWRLEPADRAAVLLENADYFAAAKEALLSARRQVLLLAWVFDPLSRLRPDVVHRSGDPEHPDRIGLLLRTLADQRPELDVQVLAWDMAWPIAASQAFAPQRAKAFFHKSRVRFVLDRTLPMSACQHQKVLVIDDRVAFCSGGDIGVDRWDTHAHRDHEPARRLPTGRRYPPRHDVTMVMEGAAAVALGDLARERWRLATGEAVAPPPEGVGDSPWPASVGADFTEASIGVARTLPRWKGQPEAREGLNLHLASIAAARRLIFLENQYLAAPAIVEALAARLVEPEGPQVVCIGPAKSPSFFDRMTMDSARIAAVRRLAAVAPPGRFAAYAPRTAEGRMIIVHSKVTIIDDDLLRVGSANLNNRGGGLDTEVDVAVEARPGAEGDGVRAMIARIRARLLGHYLGAHEADMAALIAERGVVAAIETLDSGAHRRLRPVERKPPLLPQRLVAAVHLGDPTEPDDAWRPWLRRARLRRQIADLLPSYGLTPAADPIPRPMPASIKGPE